MFVVVSFVRGKKEVFFFSSSLSLFLSLFFDGFALPSSYHHHPTAFKYYDLMTVLHLVPSSIHYAEERKREKREGEDVPPSPKNASSKQTNKHQGISDLRKKKHDSRRDEKQKRTMNHRQKPRNPRCNPFVDPHIRACLLTRPVSPRLT